MTGRVLTMGAAALLAGLPSRGVGAIVTDPPAGLSPLETRAVVREASRVIRLGGALVVIGEHPQLARILPRRGFVWMANLIVLWGDRKVRPRNFDSLYSTVSWYARAGLRHSFDWGQRSVHSNVLQCQRVPRGERSHPSEKPVGLTNFLISLLTKSDDLIVDPFCGSGSTLVSAEMCGRDWVGGDIEPQYVATATRRVAHHELEEVEPVYLWNNGRLELV